MADLIDSTEIILDKIDEQLDGVIAYMDNLTEILNQELSEKRDQAQEIVNEKMTEFSTKLTEKLEPIRNKIVDIFSDQVSVVKEKLEKYIDPISAFVTINWTTGEITPNIPTNLNDIVEVVKGIVLMLVPSPAVEYAVRFATDIFPKIYTISNKILQIATYTPEIDIPGIIVPPLDVNIDPITLNDILNPEPSGEPSSEPSASPSTTP